MVVSSAPETARNDILDGGLFEVGGQLAIQKERID